MRLTRGNESVRRVANLICFSFRCDIKLWVPDPLRFSKGPPTRMGAAGLQCWPMLQARRRPVRRFYGQGDQHFITPSCYRRKPLLGTARARDVLVAVLEQVRRRFRFDVIGFVVMPEHVHLLLGEPEKGNPSRVMQVLKQTVARPLLPKSKKRLFPN
jgi:REP element-mobilizing transposase RayT